MAPVENIPAAEWTYTSVISYTQSSKYCPYVVHFDVVTRRCAAALPSSTARWTAQARPLIVGERSARPYARRHAEARREHHARGYDAPELRCCHVRPFRRGAMQVKHEAGHHRY